MMKLKLKSRKAISKYLNIKKITHKKLVLDFEENFASYLVMCVWFP